MNDSNTLCELFFFYKLTCKDPLITNCYIGKTKHFNARASNHKNNCKENTLKVYKYIRENGGWDNWTMSTIHQEFCTPTAGNLIEYALIKQNNADLNIQIPTIYKKQDYNRKKCQEHYAVRKECVCGWEGSKMDWSHHIKSKKHKKYCIEQDEQEELKEPHHEPQLEENDFALDYSQLIEYEILN